MTFVTISKTVRKGITDVALEGETVDKTINRLLDEKGHDSNNDLTKTSARISKETLIRLQEHKVYKSEPYQSIIYRLTQ